MVDAKDLLGRDEYLLDLSLLKILPLIRVDSKTILLVPETLDGLLSAPESEGRSLLVEQVSGVRRIASRRPKDVLAGHERPILELEAPAESPVGTAGTIIQAYGELKRSGVVKVISDEEATLELAEVFGRIVRHRRTDNVVTVGDQKLTRSSLVRRHTSTILEYSRRTGAAIMTHGRQLIGKLSGRVALLELPDRLDGLVDLKQQALGRLFKFKGGKTVKLFVAALMTTAGFTNHPAIGVASLMLTFVDP